MTEKATLIIRDDFGETVEITLSEDNLTLGRGEELAVAEYPSFSNPTISREHATVSRKDGSFVLTDLESTNGTFLWQRGQWRQLPPDRPMPLYDRDRFRLGTESDGLELQIVGIPRMANDTLISEPTTDPESPKSVHNLFFSPDSEV